MKTTLTGVGKKATVEVAVESRETAVLRRDEGFIGKRCAIRENLTSHSRDSNSSMDESELLPWRWLCLGGRADYSAQSSGPISGIL
jgi:hypothetical protein